MTARVVLSGVAKRYRVGEVPVTALDGVDLTVEGASLVVILGPSGSGKTTLLNIIGALDRPSAGRACILGVDLNHTTNRQLFALRRTAVAFVFQTFNLFPALTAYENVLFGAEVRGNSRDAADITERVLEQVGLAGRSGHFPSQLSGGEQQRVAIARALATGNQILLADEPTGELDVRTGAQILELLRREADDGRTVMVVTHNREIARIADRVIELSGGRIARDGPPPGGRVETSELRW